MRSTFVSSTFVSRSNGDQCAAADPDTELVTAEVGGEVRLHDISGLRLNTAYTLTLACVWRLGGAQLRTECGAASLVTRAPDLVRGATIYSRLAVAGSWHRSRAQVSCGWRRVESRDTMLTSDWSSVARAGVSWPAWGAAPTRRWRRPSWRGWGCPTGGPAATSVPTVQVRAACWSLNYRTAND